VHDVCTERSRKIWYRQTRAVSLWGDGLALNLQLLPSDLRRRFHSPTSEIRFTVAGSCSAFTNLISSSTTSAVRESNTCENRRVSEVSPPGPLSAAFARVAVTKLAGSPRGLLVRPRLRGWRCPFTFLRDQLGRSAEILSLDHFSLPLWERPLIDDG
jgi:hypothetical protein